MPHLTPLEDSEIEDGFIKERFAHYAVTRGFTPNSIRTMARRPEMVKAFMALNQAGFIRGYGFRRTENAHLTDEFIRCRMPLLPVSYGKSLPYL